MTPDEPLADDLVSALRACTLCRDRFAATATRHAPRPVVWFRPRARVLVAGQAPGARVHAAGVPFQDASGARLRDWMGVTADQFYDLDRVAVVPMAFCFPGYDARGSDLPPPPICAATWRRAVMARLPRLQLRLLVGGVAQRWHLGAEPVMQPVTQPVTHTEKRTVTQTVTQTVADWRRHAEHGNFPLPHPSWRNTGWLRRNPWFETDLVPALRRAVARVLEEA